VAKAAGAAKARKKKQMRHQQEQDRRNSSMYYCTLTSGRSIYHAARARVRCGPRTYVRSDRNARLLVNKVSHRQAQCMVEWSGYPLPLGRFRSKVTTLTGSFCRFVQSSLKVSRYVTFWTSFHSQVLQKPSAEDFFLKNEHRGSTQSETSRGGGGRHAHAVN
jgi:hypothetical protein